MMKNNKSKPASVLELTISGVIMTVFAVAAIYFTVTIGNSLLLPLLFIKKDKIKMHTASEKLGAAVFSGIFTSFTVIGNSTRILRDGLLLNLFAFAVSICGMLFLSYTVARLLITVCSKAGARFSSGETNGADIKAFLLSFAVIFAVWFTAWLALYPGIITVDSVWQLQQAAGLDELSNHHPVASTMLIKLFYNTIYSLTGNANTAVAGYSLFQLLVLDCVVSYSVAVISKRCRKKIVTALIIAFYAVSPINIFYSISMWKDVLFGAFVLLFSTVLYQLLEYRSGNVRCNKSIVLLLTLLLISSLGICLFRTNGLIAFALTIPFLLFLFRKKLRAAAIIPVCALVAAVVILGPVYSAIGVKPGDEIEALSIPAQHIARVIADGRELTEEQRELLGKIVDVDAVKDAYDACISDPIKNLVRATDNQQYIKEHKTEYLKLWIEIGLKYPGEYIQAQIDQTYGYIVPRSYWIATQGIIKNDMDISTSPLLPQWAADAFNNYKIRCLDTVLGRLLSGCGVTVWFFFMTFCVCIARNKRQLLPVYLPSLFIWFTLLIATPVFSEFRYIYAVFLCNPLLLCIPFFGKGNDNAGDNAENI